jgi:hypothetical protein
MAGTIAKTHLLNVNYWLKQITDRIIELEKIKNKSVQQKQELKKLKSNRIELKKDVQKAENIVITAQASNEEIERYIYLVNNWASKEEALNDFKENKTISNDTIQENSYYETKSLKYPNWKELIYIETPDWYNIDNWKQSNERIDITKEEFESIKNNPENLKNLLNFKDTLTKLNIDFIWNNRFEFIKKLNNIDPTLNIKIDKENYINNTELKKILNWIITLSWNEKSTNNDIDSIKEKLRKISNSWLDDSKNDNIGTPIEKIFIKKWIIDKNSSINYFNINKMKENYR